MVLRWLRRLAVLIGGACAVYLATRTIEDRRLERRLDAPVSPWPEVAIGPPEAGANQHRS